MDEQQLELSDTPKRLFLDLSSSCAGYTIASFNTENGKAVATIHRSGAIWFDPSWTHGKKYHYIQQCIFDNFVIREGVVDIIYEKYSVNPKQAQGCLVVPEMIGCIKAACYDDIGAPIGIEEMTPMSWRKYIGLQPIYSPKLDDSGKPIVTKGGKPKMDRDYKGAIRLLLDSKFNGIIPSKIKSNITGNLRATTHDLYDALGLMMGWHVKIGVKDFRFEEGCFDT